MAKNVTQYELLISCPGDIQDEVQIIDEVVEQFNQQFSKSLGISILTRHWSKSAYSQSGASPQNILNQQIVEECDAAVAMFWTRFGTPTDQYGSGSEEEIELMLAGDKQVFMYFCDKQIEPSKMDLKQYDRVKAFREKYKASGLYYTYKTNDEFRQLIYAHLTMHFLTLKKVENIEKIKPCLVVKSIKNEKISENAEIEEFDFGGKLNKEQRLLRISELYETINQSSVSDNGLKDGFLKSLYKSVEIGENTRAVITEVARIMEIELKDSFFSLGGLSENAISASVLLGGGRELLGTEEEKKKYDDINSLKNMINDFMGWSSINDCYAGKRIIKFVIENEGQKFDEDIDVELLFSKDMFLSYKELKVPVENAFEDLIDECSVWDIFTIPSSINNISYEESCKPKLNINSSNTLPAYPFGNRKSYEEEYRETLESIFDYKIYETDEGIVVKLHIDYIKQHSVVAFPTPLFVNVLESYKDIEYKITSKQNTDVVNGKIAVKNDTNS